MERNALGRFFIGDDEISLVQADGGESFLEALARIPTSSLLESRFSKGARASRAAINSRAATNSRNATRTPKLWSPAARPLGPVLRVGLFATDDPLVHKQVVLESHSLAAGALKATVSDDVLAVNAKLLERSFEKSRDTEVSL